MPLIAKYTITEGYRSKSFNAPSLSFKKCLQMLKIMENGRKWRGFSIDNLTFGIEGLVSVSIKKESADLLN